MTHCFRPGDSMEAMLREAPKGLDQVLRECGRRYVLFNNMASDPRPQVEQLFQMVDSMLLSNGGQVCVTFSFFPSLPSVCASLFVFLSLYFFLSPAFFVSFPLSLSISLSFPILAPSLSLLISLSSPPPFFLFLYPSLSPMSTSLCLPLTFSDKYLCTQAFMCLVVL